MTLRTITPEHKNLQQISIYIPRIRHYWGGRTVAGDSDAENYPLRWSDLGRLLVELWKSHSVHSTVVFPRTEHGSATAADWARLFMPRLVERGIFDPVDADEPREPERDFR